jgi:hypothetical protein
MTIYIKIYIYLQNYQQRSRSTTKRQRQDLDPKLFQRPPLGFTDHDLINGSPNEDLPLLLIANIADYDVSRILIDQGSSCDIMFNEIFSKLQIEQERHEPYHEGPLTAFHGSTTQPLGQGQRVVYQWGSPCYPKKKKKII